MSPRIITYFTPFYYNLQLLITRFRDLRSINHVQNALFSPPRYVRFLFFFAFSTVQYYTTASPFSSTYANFSPVSIVFSPSPPPPTARLALPSSSSRVPTTYYIAYYRQIPVFYYRLCRVREYGIAYHTIHSPYLSTYSTSTISTKRTKKDVSTKKKGENGKERKKKKKETHALVGKIFVAFSRRAPVPSVVRTRKYRSIELIVSPLVVLLYSLYTVYIYTAKYNIERQSRCIVSLCTWRGWRHEVESIAKICGDDDEGEIVS